MHESGKLLQLENVSFKRCQHYGATGAALTDRTWRHFLLTPLNRATHRPNLLFGFA